RHMHGLHRDRGRRNRPDSPVASRHRFDHDADTPAAGDRHTAGSRRQRRLSVLADVDTHDAAHYITWLYQGGLGLPDRDYYFAAGAAADSTRQAFVTHVAKMFRLAGHDSATAAAAASQVMGLETSLAQASMTRVDRRDPAKTDHPMSVGQLTALAPRVGWPRYFRAIGLSAPVRKVNVAQPDFVHRVDSLLHATPVATWRAYLKYHAIASAAPWLSTPFVQEDFAFRSRFSGAKAVLPRW